VTDADAELCEFLAAWGDGAPKRDVDADVFGALGIDGDDGSEFIEQFAERFGVDMGGYRWYFHHGEEGWGLGALLFRPPDWRVETIPITREILLEAIRSRRWPIDYPPHELPKVRWDLWINGAMAVAVLGYVAAGIWRWLAG
jgi:hypothetical protein